jgi:hypothetical protein
LKKFDTYNKNHIELLIDYINKNHKTSNFYQYKDYQFISYTNKNELKIQFKKEYFYYNVNNKEFLKFVRFNKLKELYEKNE